MLGFSTKFKPSIMSSLTARKIKFPYQGNLSETSRKPRVYTRFPLVSIPAILSFPMVSIPWKALTAQIPEWKPRGNHWKPGVSNRKPRGNHWKPGVARMETTWKPLETWGCQTGNYVETWCCQGGNHLETWSKLDGKYRFPV